MGALVIVLVVAGSMCVGVVEPVCSRVIGIEAMDIGIVGVGSCVTEASDAGVGVVGVQRPDFVGGVAVGIIGVASNLIHKVFIITVHDGFLNGLNKAGVNQHTASCEISSCGGKFVEPLVAFGDLREGYTVGNGVQSDPDYPPFMVQLG